MRSKTRVLAGLGLFAALGLALAYILATGYLALKLTGSAATLDWGMLVQNWQAIRVHHPDIWQVIGLILLFATLATLLPLLNSATGRVFLAWGAPRAIGPMRDEQLRRLARQPGLSLDLEPTKVSLAALVERTRARGYASVEGRYIPGLVAAAAPILDWQGEAQAAVTLVGIDPALIAPGPLREWHHFSQEITILDQFSCARNGIHGSKALQHKFTPRKRNSCHRTSRYFFWVRGSFFRNVVFRRSPPWQATAH
ncbi:MAG: hypothetical protein JJU24_16905 [Natronohydrobacter sp.]|nr:hypothetical protein [Natronohydrobacter sp.]